MRRGSRLFRRLMKYSASACGDRFAALAGNRITGTFAAFLIARTVASTLSCVTPVEPPTMIASVPAAAASEDREAASGGVCLAGARKAPRATIIPYFVTRWDRAGFAAEWRAA